MVKLKSLTAFLISVIVLFGCNKEDAGDPGTNNNIPAVYSKIYGANSITSDGTFLTIKTDGIPDHKSVYYPQSNALYEAFSGKTFGNFNFSKNPNTIATQ